MPFFSKHNIEKSSYEKLYYRYNHAIFTCIAKKIENRDDVLDVMQEVYIHLWKFREKILFGNAENIIFNTCKQEISKFYRRTDKEPYSEELIDRADFSAHDLKAVKKKERQLLELEKSIELIIPPLRRTIFKMSKLDGISHDQIAVQLNMSKSAVENQIAKAMTFLKKHHSNY